jgi:hypothetical protein
MGWLGRTTSKTGTMKPGTKDIELLLLKISPLFLDLVIMEQ